MAVVFADDLCKRDRCVTIVTCRYWLARTICWRLSLESSEKFSRAVVGALARRREAKGVTKEGLAKKSGISRSMISMMESGQRHPTLVTLHALAKALEVPITELLAEGS